MVCVQLVHFFVVLMSTNNIILLYMWLQQSGVPKSVVAVGSSSAHPLLVGSDDLPETAPATGGQKRRNLSPTHADEEARLPLKRKLDLSHECDFFEPITLDGPSLDVELSNLVNDEDFDHFLTGEKDHGLGDLSIYPSRIIPLASVAQVVHLPARVCLKLCPIPLVLLISCQLYLVGYLLMHLFNLPCL